MYIYIYIYIYVHIFFFKFENLYKFHVDFKGKTVLEVRTCYYISIKVSLLEGYNISKCI